MVDGGNRSDDGQPQSEAARFPGARVVDAVEVVEQLRRFCVADARPLVDDVNFRPHAVEADSHLHGFTLRAVTEALSMRFRSSIRISSRSPSTKPS
ncbi:MAG: hypothetical protein OEU26_19145 [Candidatus Tectomicrobia bacterium]|nr:hypothetical protein [Candidatus Tectomicrobia bacterium]